MTPKSNKKAQIRKVQKRQKRPKKTKKDQKRPKKTKKDQKRPKKTKKDPKKTKVAQEGSKAHLVVSGAASPRARCQSFVPLTVLSAAQYLLCRQSRFSLSHSATFFRPLFYFFAEAVVGWHPRHGSPGS
jgi:hypothetical protein